MTDALAAKLALRADIESRARVERFKAMDYMARNPRGYKPTPLNAGTSLGRAPASIDPQVSVRAVLSAPDWERVTVRHFGTVSSGQQLWCVRGVFKGKSISETGSDPEALARKMDEDARSVPAAPEPEAPDPRDQELAELRAQLAASTVSPPPSFPDLSTMTGPSDWLRAKMQDGESAEDARARLLRRYDDLDELVSSRAATADERAEHSDIFANLVRPQS